MFVEPATIILPELSTLQLLYPALVVLGLLLVSKLSAKQSPGKRCLLIILRSLAVLAILFALTPPQQQTHTQQAAHMLVLLDCSESVSDQELDDLQAHLYERLQNENQSSKQLPFIATLIAYDRQQAILFSGEGQELLKILNSKDYFKQERRQRSKHLQTGTATLQDAYQLAASLINSPADNSILLLTDGRFEQTPEVKITMATQHVYVSQLDTEQELDLAIEAVQLKTPPQQQPVNIAFTINSSHADSVELHAKITQGHVTVWDNHQNIELTAGNNPQSFDSKPLGAGHYELHLSAFHPKDSNAQDNFYTQTFDINGQKEILVIHPDTSSKAADNIIAVIQSKQNHKVKKLAVNKFKNSIQQAKQYPYIFWVDVSPDALDTEQWHTLQQTLSNSGTGICFIAGESWQDLDEPGNHAINMLLPVTLMEQEKAEPEPNPTPQPEPPEPNPDDNSGQLIADKDGPITKEILTPSICLILLIDRSGSMNTDNRLEIAKASAIETAKALDGNDRIGVCAFDFKPHWIFRPTDVRNTAYITYSLSRLHASGGTAFHPALQSAYEELKLVNTNIKHVILLSDGNSWDGDFHAIVNKMQDNNITVSTVFIGDSDGAQTMARIAKWGKGNYYSTVNLKEVPRIFINDLKRRVKDYENTLDTNDANTDTVTDPNETDNTILNANPQTATNTEPDPQPETLDPNDSNTNQLPARTAESILLKQNILTVQRLKQYPSPTIMDWIPSVAKVPALVPIQTATTRSPVLTEWHMGLSKVSFISTDTYRWGAELADWSEFQNLINMIIETGQSHSTSKLQLDDTLSQTGKDISLSFLCYNEDGQLADDLNSTVRLSNDNELWENIPVQSKGLGYYNATFALPEAGSLYTVELNQYKNGSLLNRKRYYVISQASKELKSRHKTWPADDDFMTTAWQHSPSNTTPVLAAHTTNKRQSLAYYLLLFALCLFPIDILIRKHMR